MKRQRLRIKIVDHRTLDEDGSPAVTIETFDDHGAYLRRMRKIMRENAHKSEQTASLIHLYPSDQPAFFE